LSKALNLEILKDIIEELGGMNRTTKDGDAFAEPRDRVAISERLAAVVPTERT
jgi:hypothetical protein